MLLRVSVPEGSRFLMALAAVLSMGFPSAAGAQESGGGIGTGYGVGSMAVGFVDVVTIPLNVAAGPVGSGRRWHGPVGLIAGAGTIALGAAHLGDDGSEKALAILDVGVGSLAAILGLANLLSGPRESRPTILARRPEPRVAPLVTVLSDGRKGIGIILRP